MELTIGSWYQEPGLRFEFSYRVAAFIKKAIEEQVMAPLGLLDSYPEKSLHIRVSTTAAQTQLAVKMGPFRENSTSVNCKLLFPYRAIVDAADPLAAYVEYFIQALPLIFDRWGITPQQLEKAAALIRTEIIHNPAYELRPEEKSQPEVPGQAANRILQEPSLQKGSFASRILSNAVLTWLKKVLGSS